MALKKHDLILPAIMVCSLLTRVLLKFECTSESPRRRFEINWTFVSHPEFLYFLGGGASEFEFLTSSLATRLLLVREPCFGITSVGHKIIAELSHFVLIKYQAIIC